MFNVNAMDDREILARTLYGEARGEYKCPVLKNPTMGLIAVGNVVMNRVAQKTWYGHSVRDVCLKPYQFSCWNVADPNREKLLTVTADTSVFKVCLDVAEALIAVVCPDVTLGSDHYISMSLKVPPAWVHYADERITIGRHRFFKIHKRKL